MPCFLKILLVNGFKGEGVEEESFLDCIQTKSMERNIKPRGLKALNKGKVFDCSNESAFVHTELLSSFGKLLEVGLAV